MRAIFAFAASCCLAGPSPAAEPVKADRYGDPLPPGALLRLGTLRNRAPITSFGIAKDGTVVTAGPGAEVRRWRATDDRSGEPIPLPLKGPATSNNYPQVSPDGRLVAACSNEKVFVWEVPAGAKAEPKQVVTFEIGRTRLFRFSEDGTRLVVTAEDQPVGAVYVCDLKAGSALATECAPALRRGGPLLRRRQAAGRRGG